MKKLIAAVVATAFMSTTALADYICEPVYQTRWDSYYNQNIRIRVYPDRCYQVYTPRYYEPEPYYDPYRNDDLVLGMILGGITGYAIGNHYKKKRKHHRHYQHRNNY
jgi:hypothetical protein